ncbi:MAG TPA: LPS-assembly protein LptD [Piscirickettsiaceae bacterium]|nr:LPS-assembly protein LptD [Piscirickettsiaceae bacterium]
MKRTALFCISFFLCQPAGAQPCTGQWLLPLKPIKQTGPTEAWADQLVATQEGIDLSGQVQLSHPGLWLQTLQLHWDRLSRMLTAADDVQAQTHHWLLTARQLRYQRANNTLEAQAVHFQQRNRQLRGQAQKLIHNPAEEQTQLQTARLTTCPLGQDDWFVHAQKVRVDRKAQRVYAHHARLNFKGVPLLYTPYISYPLSKRASGFLIPSVQSYQSPNRENPSWLVGIPYYFNLAPNYDDTLTLYTFQDRGLMLDNEFRSLNSWQQSVLTTTWLDDQLTGKPRWRIKLVGDQYFGYGLSGRIQWQDVSDKDFFADIPIDPLLTTASFDRRQLRLDWRPTDQISAFIRHQDYLLLRNHAANYALRPQFGLTLNHRFTNQLQGQLYTEISHFDIPIDHSRPEGQRTLVRPRLTLLAPTRWGEVGATAQIQHTRYDLLDGAPGGEISVPMAEIHGTVVFERPADEIGPGWIQTLEPRLQYTHIPYVDQDALPNFDSAPRSLSFDNLFALNRFTGADRIGDTQRLSFALTTRLLSPRGHEHLRAAIGQAFYLATRHVGLTGTLADTTPRSHLFGQLRLTTDAVLFDSTFELHDGTFALRNLISRLRWRTDRLTLLSQYSWQQIASPDETQLLLTGALWQPGRNWQVGGYLQYDYTAKVRVETAWTLGYESCCWKSELQLEETRLQDGRYNYTLRLVLTLKGLSTTGRSFARLLQRKLNF